MLKTASATIALLALANPALAASCASPSEAAALRTAVIQQELMVAALQCHEVAVWATKTQSIQGRYGHPGNIKAARATPCSAGCADGDAEVDAGYR